MSKETFALTSTRSTLRATRPTKVTNPITSLPLRHHAPGTSHTSANQGTGELSPLVAYAATHSVEATLIQLGSSPRGLASDLVQASRELHGPNVIVKDLGAIHNLGAMDVLCCDKTGTLTEDRVILEYHMDVMGREDARVLRHAYLNSRFQTGLRNLIDQAITDRMGEVAGGAVRPLTDGLRGRILAKVRELGDTGMRVVAVAQKTNPRGIGAFSAADERDMVLIGYLAFLDPPKASARAAAEQLQARGVDVKVLTGDNERVTVAVCAKVGIDAAGALTDPDVDALDDAELARRAEGTHLFAHLSPLQKARVVRILREQGNHTVGLHGRRHQRRGSHARKRLRHLGGHRRRRGQGVGRHHPAQEGPARTGPRHPGGPPHLRQHHQVHQGRGVVQLWQRALGARGQRVSALPAHDGAAAPAPGACLHRLVRRASVGQR